MTPDPHQQLTQSWIANAQAWTDAVRKQRIESRRLVTDAAILDAVLSGTPKRVLDVGCGEGWLCRALSLHGIQTVGVDASAPLIESARTAEAARSEDYRVLSYAQLARAPAALGSFDAMVCNFAILDADPAPLLRGLAQLSLPNCRLVIQTVHPWAARAGADYRDGWREETFAAFGGDFRQPMPWFFRTLESWCALLAASGWQIEKMREPLHPQTQLPLSLLIGAQTIGTIGAEAER